MSNCTEWQLLTKPDGADGLEVVFTGRWCLRCHLPPFSSFNQALTPQIRRIRFVAADLAEWDSGLIVFLRSALKVCAERKIATALTGLPTGVQRLLALAAAVPPETGRTPAHGKVTWLASAGLMTLDFLAGAPKMLAFAGEICLSLARLVRGRAHFRAIDLWLQIDEVGPRALPIVAIISFLVGLILAYLGADQLRLVGAQIFIADLVAIGMLREVGALMTGIIVAGRTGAAFAG